MLRSYYGVCKVVIDFKTYREPMVMMIFGFIDGIVLPPPRPRTFCPVLCNHEGFEKGSIAVSRQYPRLAVLYKMSAIL